MGTAVTAGAPTATNFPMKQTVAIEQAEHDTPPCNAQHLLQRMPLIIDEAQSSNTHRRVETAIPERQLLSTCLDKKLATLRLRTRIGEPGRIWIDAGNLQTDFARKAAREVTRSATDIENSFASPTAQHGAQQAELRLPNPCAPSCAVPSIVTFSRIVQHGNGQQAGPACSKAP